jgi:hypothetical protein
LRNALVTRRAAGVCPNNPDTLARVSRRERWHLRVFRRVWAWNSRREPIPRLAGVLAIGDLRGTQAGSARTTDEAALKRRSFVLYRGRRN